MKYLVKVLLIAFWVIMSAVLAVVGTLSCAQRLLRPHQLTAIMQKLANDYLDADVAMGRVELAFRPKFPLLFLEVDSLTIISKSFAGLTPEQRAALPVYADTLLTVDHLSGGMDVKAFMTRNEIVLHRIDIAGAGVNIVMDGSGRGNFDIYNSNSGPDTTAIDMPRIVLDRFTFTDSKEFRYFNAIDSTAATVLMLDDAGVDGSSSPLYRLKVSGRINSPVARTLLALDDIGFGVDGRVFWSPQTPSRIRVEECDLNCAFVNAHVDASLLFDTTMVVESARANLKPLAVQDVVDALPEDIRKKYALTPRNFKTDATVAVDFELTNPMVLGTDTIPHAAVAVTIPDCAVRYGKADFRKVGLEMRATLNGNDPDLAVVEIERFDIAGPATGLRIAGNVTNAATDARFDGTVKGRCQLKSLPPQVANLLGGFISGVVTADVHAMGNASMFDQANFHKLDVRGTLSGADLFFLANDTAKMVDIDKLTVKFGTNERRRTEADTLSGRLLTAKLQVDTAHVLIDGVNMLIAGLDLGVGTENMPPSADTTLVIPIGGGIKVGRFNVESVTDSAGMKLKSLLGTLILRRYKGNAHAPEIIANLEAGSLSAGTKTTRLLLRDTRINATMHKLPPRERRTSPAVKHVADSLSRLHPDLPMDSVYRLAIEKRRHRPGEPRKRRVYGEITDEDSEVIEWDLSNGFRKFLLGWQLNGSLATRNARLFTPMFPLRNRIRQLDITFSNDSVNLRGVRYTAGRSDMAISGLISNIRRGLTSKTGNNSLKLNFNIISDTLDVNQLAAAAFAGSAYAERMRNSRENHTFNFDNDESELDREFDALVKDQPDQSGPLLVPVNLDARINLQANNIQYSDLTMTGLKGDVLMYRGALNLHDLHAASDIGSLGISALYYAPKTTDMSFSFGLMLDRIDIARFLNLVPAVDSVMPLMRDFSGIIDADIAASVDIDTAMNFVLPTLDAAVRITADSLAFINPDTYRTMGKWLRFKDKTDNRVKHVNVEMIVRNDILQIFPFEFDIDRYRLGIVGSNDLAMNFDYHIAVLKSPLPFKFGITIKGNPDKYKVRFGGANFKAGQAAESVGVVNTARVNLLTQIENVFRRGVSNSRFSRIRLDMPSGPVGPSMDTELSPQDSLVLMREGFIPDTKIPDEK